MNFCPKCGAPLPGSAKFCPKCGYDLSSYWSAKKAANVEQTQINPTPVEPTPISPSVIEPTVITPSPISPKPIVSWFMVSSISLCLTGVGFLMNFLVGIPFLVASVVSLFLLFSKLARFSFSKEESVSLSEKLSSKNSPVSADNIEKSTGLSRFFYFFQAKGKSRLFIGLSAASLVLMLAGGVVCLSSDGGVVVDPVGYYQDYYQTGSTRYIVWEIRSDQTWDYVYDNGAAGDSGTWTSFGHKLDLLEKDGSDTSYWVLSLFGDTMTSGEHVATRIQE